LTRSPSFAFMSPLDILVNTRGPPGEQKTQNHLNIVIIYCLHKFTIQLAFVWHFSRSLQDKST
jgi:hypothetical protein